MGARVVLASALAALSAAAFPGAALGLEQRLLAGDGAASDQLGFSVAIDGDTIVAGAPFDDLAALDQGSVYAFAASGAPARTETAKLAPSDPGQGDRLGSSVAIDGETTLAGAPAATVGSNASQGFAAIFFRPACTIIGTAGDDVLEGTSGADVICGLGGNEVLRGRSRADELRGGEGDDLLIGGGAPDLLDGGDGNDRMLGLHGPDQFLGGPGIDLVDYARRSTSVTASIGDGANDGDPGENDEVGADVERLRGGSGGDTLTGDLNRNVLIGGPGADSLFGLAGDDVLRADDGVADTELDCGDGSGDRLESDAGLDPAGIGCER